MHRDKRTPGEFRSLERRLGTTWKDVKRRNASAVLTVPPEAMEVGRVAAVLASILRIANASHVQHRRFLQCDLLPGM